MSARAQKYRELHAIPARWGTAVNVQAMVFGNMGETSATGVAFTRNPSTGEQALYGEFLINAQGEDVVAGIRTPQDITEKARASPSGSDKPSMEAAMPEAYARARADLRACSRATTATCRTSSSRSRAASSGCCRRATASAPPRRRCGSPSISPSEGLITQEEAVLRVDPAALDQLLHPDHRSRRPSAASSRAGCRPRRARPRARSCSTPDEAESREEGRPQGHPGARRDLARGHPRHARGRGHPDHARRHDLPRGGGGARHGQALRLRRRRDPRRLRGADAERRRRDAARRATSSRSTARPGRCCSGEVPMLEPELSGEFATLMGWADDARRLKVRANADTPLDARTARELRRRGHRPLPHRAHVLRGRPHRRRARDDPRRRRGRPRARRSPSSCRCSAPTSSSSSPS